MAITDQVPDVDQFAKGSLIASDRVEGTRVYDLAGKHIGAIERVMLTKRSGQVAYAVLSFGGFLGMDKDHYPLPWAKLDYDEELGGYKVDVTKEQLESAPRFNNDEWDGDPDLGAGIYSYYGVTPMPWM